MKLFPSLDSKDRRLLIGCGIAVLALALLTVFLPRNENDDNNPVPSSYLTGRHGARAAYETLQASGYNVQRWEQPLSDLANRADNQTVVIFAEPDQTDIEAEDLQAVRDIVAKGGRILVTGWTGGMLAPDGNPQASPQLEAQCQLTAQGLDPLASSGEVWMAPEATWGFEHPLDRVDYNCAGSPAVVEYAADKGRVVWWASSTPLENGTISRAHNLNLFLSSLGPRDGHNFYWDESLHGEARTEWYYASGPAMWLLRGALLLIGVLIVFSFSRRRGPVRDLPVPVRTTPVEFLEALGSLYAEAKASATAVELAYERFRRRMGDLCGLKGAKMSAQELAIALRRRFPNVPPSLEKDLADCEAAANNDKLQPKSALALVQALGRLSETINAAARPSGPQR
ncbi:MAG TPA: DUF4350 domain-containing protein [Terracidiphilus sp.]|nr:DUF4350 domain-containing protein [Terracidiphilus sp.]